MPRFVALLRGVNVGKGKRVPMAGLRALVEELGGGDVATVLNSGNIVFTHPGRSAAKQAHALAEGIEARFGVATPVIVKSAAEFAAIVAGNPMPPRDADHSRFVVAFAADADGLEPLRALQARVVAPERFVVDDRAAYLHCPGGLLESPTAVALLGRAGKSVTTRNWATVLKLAALAG